MQRLNIPRRPEPEPERPTEGPVGGPGKPEMDVRPAHTHCEMNASTPSTGNQEKGGKGADADWTSRSAKVAISRALRQGWEIPEGLMKALPGVLIAELNKPNQNSRNKLASVKLLMAMARDNTTTGQLAHTVTNVAEPAVTVNIDGADSVTVNQRLTTEDIVGVMDELGVLGVVDRQNPTTDVPAAQTDEETTGVFDGGVDGPLP